jgi:hypothetical protein
MSSRWSHAGQVVLGLAILGGIVVGGYYFLRAFDPPIVTAVIAAGVALGVALISSSVQKKRELEFKIRERKVEAYQKIFDFTRYFISATKSQQGFDEAKLVEYFYDINYALVMWGNSESIVRWHEMQFALQAASGVDQTATVASMLIWRHRLADLIRVIRKDLGHVDTNLSVDILADLYMPLRDKDELVKSAIEAANANQNAR